MTRTVSKSDRPTNVGSTLALLDQRCQEAKEAQKEREAQNRELGFQTGDLATLKSENATMRKEVREGRQPYRGMASNSIVEIVQEELFAGEAIGHYSRKKIQPQSAIPRAMTRFGFFMPHERRVQKDLVDEELSLSFETPWGRAVKSGKPLNVSDEDVFLSLGRMQQYELCGNTKMMPISVQDPFKREAANVHTLIATPGMIREQLRLSKAGLNNKKIHDSIKRIATNRLEFEQLRGLDEYCGTVISLFDVAWQRYKDDGVYYIQFSPIISEWFADAVTYIDWDVRMALPNSTSKAVHRFLSGQPKNYEIGNEKLKKTILHQGAIGEFNRDIKKGFAVMKDMGWLKYWDIEGTGRKTKQKIIIER